MEIIIIALIALIIFLVWLYYNNCEYRKEKERIENEKRHNYLERILLNIDKPDINIFKIPKAAAIENPYNIEIIEKFNDFSLLSDFNSANLCRNASINGKNIFLITQSLKSELVQHKQFIEDYINRIKLGYFYAYLGRFDRNYEKSHEYLDDCQEDNDMLEEEVSGNVSQKMRRHIVERDKWCCVLCGEKVSERLLDIHHVKYRSRGGGHELENLVTLCRYCHAGLPHHYKIAEYYRQAIELQNKKIFLNIYEKRPDFIGEIILTRNPLIKYFNRNHFIFKEETLSKKLYFIVEPHCFVKVYESEREKYFIYQASIDFSRDSPLGKSLMNARIGENAQVEIPGEKTRTLKILEIKPPNDTGYTISCEKCHAKLKIPPSYNKLRCPECGYIFY